MKGYLRGVFLKSYLSDFNEISKAAAERDRVQAVHDLNHEMSGVETGRLRRFLTSESHDATTNGKRGGRSGEVLSALDLALMADPAYAELYDGTFNRLRDAEAATERALMKAEEALADARAALDTTLGRSATLEDGTRVFKDAQGKVWTEHGQLVDPGIAEQIEWKGHEPDRETFLIRKQTFDAAQEDVSDLRGYQVRLGDYRTQMMDEDNPPSRAELEEIDSEVAEIMHAVTGHDAPEADLPDRTATAKIVLPGLGD